VHHVRFCRLAAHLIPASTTDASPRTRLVFDVEADGLVDTATKLHCAVIADLDDNHIDEFGPNQIDAALGRLSAATCLIGHNIVNYDVPLLCRLYNWTPPPGCVVIDTLVVSRLILANLTDLDDQAAALGDPKMPGKLRGSHSLEAWGVRLGVAKVGADIEDFSRWSPELQARCVGDVRLNKALWQFLRPDGQPTAALAQEHRVAGICDVIAAAGIPFDRIAAEHLCRQWTAQRDALEAQLREQFPAVTNLNSRVQIGRLLEERGWTPTERTAKTGQAKLDDEILESIGKQFPEFVRLVEYYVLGRRLGQLAHGKKAWLHHVGADDRVHGGIIHIGTPHHRAAHQGPNLAQVPNPKRGKPFAGECRSLSRCNDDWTFVTCDQAGLQDRAFAHYLADHDDGAYARAFVAGLDPHWAAAQALGVMPATTARDKTNKFHEALREGCKSFRYAFIFGAQSRRAGVILYNTIRIAAAYDPACDLPQRFFPMQATPRCAASAARRWHVSKQPRRVCANCATR
jgi:DNA polymerase-1